MSLEEKEYDLVKSYTTGKIIELGVNINFNDIVQIKNINSAVELLSSLSIHFKLGMDNYKMNCSGDATNFRRVNSDYISFFTTDNNCFFTIKFKSLIIYNPPYDSDMSPIFILECDDDIPPQKSENVFLEDDYSVSIYHTRENLRIIHKYHKRKMFCFFNIQGLSFGNFRSIICECQDLTGEELTAQLKKFL